MTDSESGSPPQLHDSAFGNYFVANYPPFSCWNEDGARSFREQLDHAAGEPQRRDIGLYVHVPFCMERCEYCYYLSYGNKPAEVTNYVDALLWEIGRYASLPAIADRDVAFAYFGGGTPSVLPTAHVRRLFEGLQKILPWDHTREVTFECAPKTVSAEKLAVLRDRGVTRLSMGIQQLDDDVLRASGRVHLVRDIERALGEIRRADFPVVNLDLMVGMIGETEESFQESLRRVIEWSPESVTIYQLEIPLNTPLYHAIQEDSLDEAPASWALKRERLGRAWRRLEDAGYTQRSAYTAVRDPERHRFVYQDEQYHGADVLGIGTSAFSHVSGVNHQNLASLRKYLGAIRDDALPLWRGHVLSDEEVLIRELVLQLKLGRAESDYFRRKFGVELGERFAEPIAALREQGLVEDTDDAIALTHEGLLRADELLPLFYRPEHRRIRYS